MLAAILLELAAENRLFDWIMEVFSTDHDTSLHSQVADFTLVLNAI